MNVVCVLKFFDGTLLPVLRIVRKESVYPQLCEAPEGPVPGNWGQTLFFRLMPWNKMLWNKPRHPRRECCA